MKKFKRILCVGDIHAPFHHKDAFKFIDALVTKYKPDKTVIMGDEIDGHTISFHQTDPDIPFSPSSELEKAIWYLKDLYTIIPKADVLDSNHGSLIYRRQKYAGIPRCVMRNWNEILEAPKGWKWHLELTIPMSNGQNVYFHHGLSKNPLRASQNKALCYVQGHHHGNFEVQYWANSKELFWAVNTGCLIDRESLAFEYGRNNLPKPIIGLVLIDDGVPRLFPMKMKKNGRWKGEI